MNNSITDNGTPNNQSITIRVMSPPFLLPLPDDKHGEQATSFLRQTPYHSAASMPLRQRNYFDVFSALYGCFQALSKGMSGRHR